MPSSANISEILIRYEERSKQQRADVERIWQETMELLARNLRTSSQSVANTMNRDMDRLHLSYTTRVEKMERTFALRTEEMEEACQETLETLQKHMQKERKTSEMAHLRRWATPILFWLLIVAVIPVLSVLGVRWYWQTSLEDLKAQVAQKRMVRAVMGDWDVSTRVSERGRFLVIPKGYDTGWTCGKKKHPCVRVND